MLRAYLIVLHLPSKVRKVSTSSAIKRGIGRSVAFSNRNDNSSDKDEQSNTGYRNGEHGPAPLFTSQDDHGYHSSAARRFVPKRINDGSYLSLPSVSSSQSRTARHGEFRASKGSTSIIHSAPIPVPHTTAASEFLYGRSVVEAALRSGKRQMYKLYIQDTGKIHSNRVAALEPLIELARSKGVKVKALGNRYAESLLDKMSDGRPHNGIVLEASPLHNPVCTSLQEVDRETRKFNVTRSGRSGSGSISGGIRKEAVNMDSASKRFPFLLLMDGIVDPGNLGGILRSAFYLGVDGVILSAHCAPLSPVALKASAGAAEILPLLSTPSISPFIRKSQNNGWKFYAAMPSYNKIKKPTYNLRTLGFPILHHPCVVVLGGEGSGLWQDIQLQADYFITINGPRAGQAGIDSLNVSVSAALLIEAFLRTPPRGRYISTSMG